MTVKRTYYENGKLASERHMKGSERHGLCRGWFANGQLSHECYFKNGQFHGRYREWSFDGKLGCAYYFRNDVKIQIPEGTLPVE